MSLGQIDRATRAMRWLTLVRLLLPLGWALAAIGYYSPWITHPTSALTLTGADIGEFVKFLPDVLDGSLKVTRQLFYLPPFAAVISVALLIGSRRLRYPWPFCLSILILAIPVSLQLLPPAWSAASLTTTEFRLQTVALGICWLLLAGFWLLARLPSWLLGSLSSALSLAAGGLTAWQFLAVKSAIDEVYRTPPAVGWGYFLCLIGLAITAGTGTVFLRKEMGRSGGP